MTDVAQAAGVSQSTVSMVLNNMPGARLAESTRERVWEAARRLGYPLGNRGAVAEAGRAVVMLVDEVSTSPFAALSIDGAREAAWDRGCTLLLAATRNDPAMEAAALGRLLAQPVDGVIYASILTRQVEPPPLLATVRSVLLNCYAADRAYASVRPGEVAGGHAAANRLIRAGHRRIAYINGEPWMEAARDRLKGYRNALAGADIPFDPELVRQGNWLPSSGYEQTLALMALANPPTAIFCANDKMATGCYEALAQLGRRVPQDVAVVGYDNEEIAQHMHPPLTTVLLPHVEMGRWAVEYLLAGADSGAKPPQVKLECPLVERDSV